MADTTFTNGVTVTDADWFNDLNRLHYTIFNDPADFTAVQTAMFTNVGAVNLADPSGFITFPSKSQLSGGQIAGSRTVSACQAGTFTPTLKFGGASTGITSSTADAVYSRINNLVYISVYIVLTSKGSATGTATIGLPFAANIVYNSMGIAQLSNMTTAQPDCYWQIAPSGTVLTLYNDRSSTGTPSAVTDAAFSNTSIIMCSGCYLVP